MVNMCRGENIVLFLGCLTIHNIHLSNLNSLWKHCIQGLDNNIKKQDHFTEYLNIVIAKMLYIVEMTTCVFTKCKHMDI